MDDPAVLERRLDAGEWLSPGAVAVLLGVGRTTVHYRLEAGVIRYRLKGAGIQRLCNPEDVRRLLAEARAEHRGAG